MVQGLGHRENQYKFTNYSEGDKLSVASTIQNHKALHFLHYTYGALTNT